MTAASPLKSLKISAFRGSTGAFSLPFEKGRKLTLVYGENGTGKTTVCDALEFLAHERVSSLDGFGLGKGLEQYWPSAGKALSDISITLETSTGTCTGVVIGKVPQVTPAASRPKIELLRRQQILNLIQAQPAQRYEAIKRFIDIGSFEASEETLRQLGKTLVDERKIASQSENQSLEELQGFYEASGVQPGINPIEWAKQKLAEPAEDLEADVEAIGKLRTAVDSLSTFPDRHSTRQKAVSDATETLTSAENKLVTVAGTLVAGTAETLAVLEAGSKYLHDHPSATECPLCLSSENIATLANDVAGRLSDLENLRVATLDRRDRAEELTQAQKFAGQTAAEYAATVNAYLNVKAGHIWKPAVQMPPSDPPADIELVGAWLNENAACASAWPELEASWRDESKFAASLKGASERYSLNLSKREELDRLIPLVDQSLQLCVEQRQAFTSTIIGEIADNVGKLYEKVHPGEGLDKISLPLDPKKRASIMLEAEFSGQGVPPQAYFSQSHLDTLGLCVFMSLAARDGSDETILILDDVLGSVDEPHVERVVGMIYDVSQGFRHTIVTTHYRPWREKFRWGFLKPDQVCQFAELTPWTLADGMGLTGSVPEIERLKAFLAEPSPDVQSICAKAGVILEALLDFITVKYACSVPRRPAGTYTLGDLLPSVNGKLLAALMVEAVDHTVGPPPSISPTELKPILDQITSIAQTRNVMGAHFNQLSFDLYPSDGIKFGSLVVQLADAIICPDHGWPGKDKSGSYWNNGGDTRRLHPLKKPA